MENFEQLGPSLFDNSVVFGSNYSPIEIPEEQSSPLLEYMQEQNKALQEQSNNLSLPEEEKVNPEIDILNKKLSALEEKLLNKDVEDDTDKVINESSTPIDWTTRRSTYPTTNTSYEGNMIGGVKIPTQEIKDSLITASKKYGIPVEILARQTFFESSFNPNALNKKSGARGISQFTPDTARDYGVDATNVKSSIDGQARFIKKYYDIYGNYEDALDAYHAGPNRPRDWRNNDVRKKYIENITGYRPPSTTHNSNSTSSPVKFSPNVKNSNVNVKNLNQDLKLSYNALNESIGGGLVITSGNDSKHGTNSKHYENKAIDVRVRDAAGQRLKQDVVSKGKFVKRDRFGTHYKYKGLNILDENDHLHISID